MREIIGTIQTIRKTHIDIKPAKSEGGAMMILKLGPEPLDLTKFHGKRVKFYVEDKGIDTYLKKVKLVK